MPAAPAPATSPAHPPRAPTLTPLLLWLAAAVAVVAIVLAAANRVRTDQAQAVAAQAGENHNLAIAHAERVSYALQVFDQLLRLVRDEWQRGGAVDDAAIRQRLAAVGLDGSAVQVLSLIDARGDVIATTLTERGFNYADRDYFRHHRDEAADALRIGVPHQGRVTQRWGVGLTRRLQGPDGRFAGVAYLSLDPGYLTVGVRDTERAPDASLALVGLDGMTLARRDGDAVSFGQDVRSAELFKRLPQSPHGHYQTRSAYDGVERLVSYRQLRDQPLVATVASTMDAVLATPRERALQTWTAAALGSAGVLALAWVLAAGLKRDARAVASLAASEQRFRLVFEHSLDAVLRTRPDGTVMAANLAACRLFGLSEAQLCLLGRAGLVDAEDPRLPPLLAERARSGRASGFVRMRRGDGTLFEAELSSALYDEGEGGGKLVGSLIVRDCTERLRAEAERQRLEAQLRESQKLEAIGTLAGGIAHDFNNILPAIITHTELARQDLGPDHPAAPGLAQASQAAQRARSLVQQILAFSRSRPEQRECLHLQPLLAEALSLLRATLPATARLEVALAPQPLHAVADPTQLVQVVMNLCTNAWQSLPRQQGTVTVSLDVAGGGDGQHQGQGPGNGSPCARLRVQDDGHGMDEATRARIFEPFFTTRLVGQGTGLGLAVVHGIVTAHGGTVQVRSAPGQGAVFDVLLPLAPAPAVASAVGPSEAPDAAPAPAQSKAPAAGARLMVVDDDETAAMTLEALLSRAGHDVSRFDDPARALAALQQSPAAWDLVVSDYNMPGQSGLDLARGLCGIRPDLPVIITTGYVTADLERQASAAGVRRVLGKEFVFERLPGVVSDVLSEVLAGR